MTRHVPYAEFRANLAKYLDEAAARPVHVEREAGSVIVMSEEEFEGWNETIHLLRSAANAEDLLKAIKAADNGDMAEHGILP